MINLYFISSTRGISTFSFFFVLVAGKAAEEHATDTIIDGAGGNSAAAEKTYRYEWQVFHGAKGGKNIFLK